jgi:hypothetical protein
MKPGTDEYWERRKVFVHAIAQMIDQELDDVYEGYCRDFADDLWQAMEHHGMPFKKKREYQELIWYPRILQEINKQNRDNN